MGSASARQSWQSSLEEEDTIKGPMTVCYRRPAQQLVVKNIFFLFLETGSTIHPLFVRNSELPDFALLGLKMWSFFF